MPYKPDGLNITVYMKPGADRTGPRHEHNGVRVTVHDFYLRVAYVKSDIVLNYPFTSIEKWEER